MTKRKIIVAFSAILLLLSTITTGQSVTSGKSREKLEFERERSISKTYPANGNSLSLENIFGDIKVNAWDKNEVKVDIKIRVASNDKEVCDRTFENIQVNEGLSGNTIRFKTSQSDKKGYSCKNCRTEMHIDYEVYMPVNLKFDISNSFGNIELPDYRGRVSVSNKFGALTTGNLADVKDLNVEFGKANIKSLKDVSAVFKFSKVQLGNLSGANKVKLEFCDSSKIVMANDLTELTLNESYSTINLRPAASLGATYNIQTSFGTFIDRTNVGVVRTDIPDRYGPDSDRRYEGKSGNGSVKVNVRSSFGRIILGEATDSDMKKSSKKFSKNAGRVI